MKLILFFAFSLFSFCCLSQKYVLLDTKMSMPVTYADDITVEQNYKGIFPVEITNIKKFLSEVEKLSKMLLANNTLPDAIDFAVGSTSFHGVKVYLKTEERIDVVITTNCDNSKITMHLADAKKSNANNAYHINTWLKYIRGYIK
jgi:hypothetical protein